MERVPAHGIEVFLAIVREGSMRAAADVLGVGAPTVTIQLKALEELLGVGLLFRTSRGIELTDALQLTDDVLNGQHLTPSPFVTGSKTKSHFLGSRKENGAPEEMKLGTAISLLRL